VSAPRDFPEGFFFGAATAAHQVEGGNVHSDWWRAEAEGRLPERSGEACGHFERFREDFDLARRLGHNAHRFSVEWSRIEPEPGRFDEAALAHYVEVVEALRERGLEPFLTLHHFTNPAWFAEAGGWCAPEAPQRFSRYVEAVAEALGGRVFWWFTVNEPTVWVKHAFVTGDWPPFLRGRWDLARRAIRGMMEGHRRAYAVLHRRLGEVRVGFAHSAPFVAPREPATLLDRLAAGLRDLVLNVLPVRGARPFDFLGLNYYARSLVHWRPRGSAALFGVDWLADDQSRPRRFSDMGWEIFPEGLEAVLVRLARLGVPLVVSENGLSTTDEAARTRYLLDHLAALGRALRRGVDVRGYFWWSLMDNYEWALGRRARFGLYETDYATLERRPRPIARVYREVCLTGRLPRRTAPEMHAP